LGDGCFELWGALLVAYAGWGQLVAGFDFQISQNTHAFGEL